MNGRRAGSGRRPGARGFSGIEAALAGERAWLATAVLIAASACLLAGMAWLAFTRVTLYEATSDVRFVGPDAADPSALPASSSDPILIEARFSGPVDRLPAGTPGEVRFAAADGAAVVVAAEVSRVEAGTGVVQLLITDAAFQPAAGPVSARVVVARPSRLARLVGRGV